MTINEIKKILPFEGVETYRKYHDKYQKWSNIWRNKYSHRKVIGSCGQAFEEFIQSNTDITYENFYYFYIMNIRNIDEIKDIANQYYIEINSPLSTTIEECIKIVILHAVIETYDGKKYEKDFIQFLKSNDFEIKNIPYDDDFLRGIDIFSIKNEQQYLIQIKPISFFISNREDCIRDRIDATNKRKKALEKYPNSHYIFSIYNKKNGQWASTPSGKISWNIDRLIMPNGSCLIDFKNYKYYKDIS